MKKNSILVVVFGLVLSFAGNPVKNGYERSEEHTSELQSHSDLVCRLLLEKKKKNMKILTVSKLN